MPHKSGKDTYLIYAATVLFGRKRPSFRILLLRVVRLTPSLFAAPFGPPITQFVSIRVLRMWLYSASPSVTGGAGLTCSAHRRLSNGARSVAPGDRMTARSTKFCSSRTFPGQAYCISVLHRSCHHLHRNGINSPVHTARTIVDESFHQQRDVFTPLPQRRDSDWEDVEAEVEIAAKLLLSDHLFQVLIGCSHQAHIHALRMDAAQVFKLLLLQNSLQRYS